MSASASTVSPLKKLLTRVAAAVAAAVAASAAAATLAVAPVSASTTGNWVMTGWNIHQPYRPGP